MRLQAKFYTELNNGFDIVWAERLGMDIIIYDGVFLTHVFTAPKFNKKVVRYGSGSCRPKSIFKKPIIRMVVPHSMRANLTSEEAKLLLSFRLVNKANTSN